MPALQAPRHRPRQRQLDQDEHDEPAEQRRRERAEQRARASVDGADRLVDLEQQLRAAGRADDRVRLEQLSLRALEAVH